MATLSSLLNGYTGPQGPQGQQGQEGEAGDKYATTSSSSNSIGTGSKTFTVDSELAYSTAQTVIIAYDASNTMEGEVTSYSGTTLVINVTSSNGSGTYTSWNINLAGAPGPAGDTGAQGPQGNIGAQGPIGNTGDTGLQGNQGIQGPQGNTGAQGAEGNQGSLGPQGNTGEQGPQGNTGAIGPQGPEGFQGSQGLQGPQGQIGAEGTQGNQGIEGPTGNTGAQGALGPQGNQGLVGPQGNVGIAGPTGDTGAQGPQGNQGSVGPQGSVGIAGTQGNQGPQGLQGDVGDTGAQGNQGIGGPQGIIGTQGAQGPQGLEGEAGDKYATTSSSSNSIGTGSKTFTVDSGLAYSAAQTVIIAHDVSNTMEGEVTSYSGTTLIVDVSTSNGSGTYTSWSINLAGAPGPAGDTGAQGPQGSSGTNGTQGPEGFQGPQGANAPNALTWSTTGTDGYVATYKTTDTAEPESKLIFANSNLDVLATNAVDGLRFFGGVYGEANPKISTTIGNLFGTIEFDRNILLKDQSKIAFDGDLLNTYIAADTDNPENLEIHADNNIQLFGDVEINDNLSVGTISDVEQSILDLQGTSGSQGPQGLQGPQGSNGTNGTQGPQGLQGPQGSNGTNGTQGPQGLQGPQGSNGTNGAQGPQGPGFSSISSPSNNRILTSDGSTDSAVAEANLSFDGNYLNIEGAIRPTPLSPSTKLIGSIDVLQSHKASEVFNGKFIELDSVFTQEIGVLYNLTDSGYTYSNASSATYSTNFLGIGTFNGNSPNLFYEGMFTILDSRMGGTASLGAPIYADDTAGVMTFDPPSGTGSVVRIIGHCVQSFNDKGTIYNTIRFNPSHEWLEL